HFLDAVARMKTMGAQSVMLSLGARRVVASDSDGTLEAVPPRVDALCPIGAGDASAAAFVWAAENGKPFSDCVRWAVAAGTASARLAGTTFAALEQTQGIYKSVELRPIVQSARAGSLQAPRFTRAAQRPKIVPPARFCVSA